MACVSHLPHVLANLLASQAAACSRRRPHGPAPVGRAFRDASAWRREQRDLDRTFYLSNRDALTGAIDDSQIVCSRRARTRRRQAPAVTIERARRADRDRLLTPGPAAPRCMSFGFGSERPPWCGDALSLGQAA